MDKKRLTKKTLKVNDFFTEFEKDDLKSSVSIVSLFNHFNVQLNRKGKNYIASCPWHDDKTPSLSVDDVKGLYNCFGCGESGDIFTLVEKMKGLSFKESLEYLRVFKADNANMKPESAPLEAMPIQVIETIEETGSDAEFTENDRVELLTKITDYCHRELASNKEALEYLKNRGIDDLKIINDFNIGFAVQSMAEKLSEKDKRLFEILGGLNEKGNLTFAGRLTFPLFDSQGNCTGIYGRSTDAKTGLKHLYLKGEHSGLFNGKAAKVYDTIVLTESVIDSLSLIQAGILYTIPCYGTNGFTDLHLEALKDGRVKEVVICFDHDEAGKISAEKLKERLIEEDFTVKVIFPMKKDLNDELLNLGKDVLKFAIEDRIKLTKIYRNEPPKSPKGGLAEDLNISSPDFSPEGETKRGDEFEISKDGFHFIFKKEDVTYRVSGVKEMFINNLRVNMRASLNSGNENDESYYDNIDLYSARSRRNFASSLSAEFETESKVVEKDLLKILEYLEERRDKKLTGTDENTKVELTADEREAGMKFLKDENFFEILVSDMEKLGYVGEELNKKLLYIAASSRKLEDPVSVLIISQSSSGKSYLVDTVKELIPPEDVISVTSLSDQALNYISDMEHKFLVLSEAVHNEVVEHQLREMLSAKELSRMVTVKDNTGTLTTRIVKTKTIVSTVMSSTNNNINPENASRSFVIDADESREQTKRIHEKQRSKYTLERYKQKTEEIPAIIKRHHAAQRLLEKRVIVNPFAKYMDFPDMLMRTRRDHDRFMDLIACICFIRQFQKESISKDKGEFIECDLTDYRIAYDIMIGSVLSSTLFDIPKAAIEVYESIRKYVTKVMEKNSNLAGGEVSFSQRDIREFSELNQMQIKRNVRLLVDFEYLYVVSGGRARSKGIYRLVKNEPIEAVSLSRIPSPEDIQNKFNKNPDKTGSLGQTGSDPDL